MNRSVPSDIEATDPTDSWDELLAKASRWLVEAKSGDLAAEIQAILRLIGELTSVDRVVLWVQHLEDDHALRDSFWAVETAVDPPERLLMKDFPQSFGRLREGQALILPDLEALSEELGPEADAILATGATAHLSVPARYEGDYLVFLALAAQGGPRDWSDVPVEHLKRVGDILAGAVARRDTHEALVASEDRLRWYMARSADGIWCVEFDEPLQLDTPEEDALAIMYQQARMVETNEALARMYGYETAEEMGTWWLNEYFENNEETRDFLAAAYHSRFNVSLESHEKDREGNSKIFMNRLSADIEDGQALRVWGTQSDLTETRKAEEELRKLRDNYAHLSRLSSMGELVATIAHELNQPLTATLTNAYAAQQFLARDEIDLDEIRSILSDIADDTVRAGEVIRRSRSLVAGSDTELAEVDLNQLVEEFGELLRRESTTRGIQLEVELAPSQPIVMADPIRVQQVLLNLVINAWEATEAQPTERRRVAIRTDTPTRRDVEVTVADQGIGLGETAPEELFQAFRTTKENGLGMGLAICRSIAESQGGRIEAFGNEHGGATFKLTLQPR